MNNDDSFNDSDEIFSLYSSKKVTDTFKAQLKKIAANNHHANSIFSHVNKESKKDENTNPEILTKKGKEKGKKILGKERVVPVVEAPIVILEDESPNISVEFNEPEPLLEDSVELITEITPTRTTRQSQKLKKIKGQLTSPPKNSRKTIAALKKPNRGRKTRSRGNKKQNWKPIDEITLDDSPQPAEIDDELNPEISVKVIWKSVNMKKFPIRKFQKLSYIFEQLSKEENIPEDKIILTFNNVGVSPNDTPDSLNLQVYHFLDGGVLSELSNLGQTPNLQNLSCGSDSVIIKFQDVSKKIIKLSLNKNEKLKVAMIKCSEQLEIPLNKIKFFFDGELVNPGETPDSLGIENDEVIDIKISS